MKFDLGKIVITPEALILINSHRRTPKAFIERHAAGDWGCVCPDDANLNEQALNDGSRLLSAYCLEGGQKIWIITEAADDAGRRAATTVVLPHEY
jgi:hypothetical protein